VLFHANLKPLLRCCLKKMQESVLSALKLQHIENKQPKIAVLILVFFCFLKRENAKI